MQILILLIDKTHFNVKFDKITAILYYFPTFEHESKGHKKVTTTTTFYQQLRAVVSQVKNWVFVAFQTIVIYYLYTRKHTY